MYRFLLVIVAATLLNTGQNVEAETITDGFIVKSIGSHENRELRYVTIKNGKPESDDGQLICKKGTYADIQGVISMDGRWVAFSREIQHFDGQFNPPGDYHNFGNYNIHIVRIDGTLPAEPILIGHGYFPSWGEDSNGDTKTLYYSYTELYDSRSKPHDQIIHKVTINKDGSFTPPIEHARCPKQVLDAHMQAAPNGRYVAYRPSDTIRVYDIQEKREIIGAGGDGCHPCWGPNSRYLLWAKSNVCLIEDGKTVGSWLGNPGKSGLGYYHFGTSNDMKWAITKTGGGQNTSGIITFHSIITDNNGWTIGSTTKAGTGTWCDIHVGSVKSPIKVTSNHHKPYNNKLKINISQHFGPFGPELIISTQTSKHTVVLYDLRGVQRAFIASSNSLQTVIPLHDIQRGRYIVAVHTSAGSVQKSIFIMR